MKNLIVILLAIFMCSMAFSQVQIYTKYSEDGIFEPDINVFSYGPKFGKKENFKITYFVLAERAWAEGLMGINYAPKDWMEFGISFGIEQNPKLFRLASNIWVGNEKWSFFTWAEKGFGVGNYWYNSSLNYSINKNLEIGIVAWRFNGVGTRIKTKFDKISIWVFPAYDIEFQKKNITVGVDIKI